MTVLANQLLKRQESVETAELDGEWVLLDLESHSITKVNEMGGYIWELLETCPTISQLAERVATEYAADPVQVQADVEVYVAELVRVGLIVHE
ncbi:PqqD family protein [Paenibacillus albicereus]|uniref:PqqD family protein n=1 Tax=Paenibacillus albicereus TaxID=2726185 RepID=A0A6H2GUN6_9BACL|nr:PqqD family protein [Paenibacillus albicereus]QJC51143.1 PqqD family protein [Paenibacillus albicereus]